MDRFFILLLIIRSTFASDLEVTTELTSVSNSPYTRMLYQRVQTEEAPPDTDLSVVDPLIRDRICSTITGSEFFSWWHLSRVDKDEVLLKYSEVFPRIYRLKDSTLNSYEYTNPYEPQQFVLIPHMMGFQDHLFVCPLKRSFDKLVIPFYVSKQYNISSFDGLYKPARFVFGSYYPTAPYHHGAVILAEEPARVHTDSNFNIELHYLRLRNHFEPVEENDIDPLCRLITGTANQHYRLCAAISSSSAFKHEIFYPRETITLCLEREISFQTPAAVEKTHGKSYKERMTLCLSSYRRDNKGRSFLYISRAYMSNQVLVFRLDTMSQKIYLENLSTNIDVVDELNSFYFVED